MPDKLYNMTMGKAVLLSPICLSNSLKSIGIFILPNFRFFPCVEIGRRFVNGFGIFILAHCKNFANCQKGVMRGKAICDIIYSETKAAMEEEDEHLSKEGGGEEKAGLGHSGSGSCRC
jgi:hypothetical protein